MANLESYEMMGACWSIHLENAKEINTKPHHKVFPGQVAAEGRKRFLPIVAKLTKFCKMIERAS